MGPQGTVFHQKLQKVYAYSPVAAISSLPYLPYYDPSPQGIPYHHPYYLTQPPVLKPITTYPDDAIAIPSLPSVTKVPLSNVHTIATWKPKKLPTPTTYPSQPKSVPTW